MPDLVDGALRDLGANSMPSVECALRTVASVRAEQVLDGAIPSDVALKSLAALYLEFDHSPEIQDFYFLRWAVEDLKVERFQWYWPSATRENIDQIVIDQFRSWLVQYPPER